jgi:hypothetical protein
VLEPEVPPAAPLPVPVAPVPLLVPLLLPVVPAPVPVPIELPCPPVPARSLADEPGPEESLLPIPPELELDPDILPLLETVPERAPDDVPLFALLSPPRSCSHPMIATPLSAKAAAVKKLHVFRMGGSFAERHNM